MQQLETVKANFGEITFFTNQDKTILLAKPKGYIGPSLVKKDLAYVEEFEKSIVHQWTYLIDISNVKAVSPINPFLLKGLKRFERMQEYVVYAPSPIIRMLLLLSSWINKPDRIIKTQAAFELELSTKF